MVYVGLDLHKRYITACALDAEGGVLAEDRRLTTDIATLVAWLGHLTGPVTVVLEATLFEYAVSDSLTLARSLGTDVVNLRDVCFVSGRVFGISASRTHLLDELCLQWRPADFTAAARAPPNQSSVGGASAAEGQGV